jgi:hypothetical protein
MLQEASSSSQTTVVGVIMVLIPMAMLAALMTYIGPQLRELSGEEISNLHLSSCEKGRLKKMYDREEDEIVLNKHVLKIAKEYCDKNEYKEKENKEQTAKKQKIIELLNN